MGILDRINLLVRSNVNEMLSSSDSPDRTLDRSIGDMQSSLREAQVQLRKCERNEEQLQRQWSRSREEALQWEDKAMEALRGGDETLARECLVYKQRIDERAQGLKNELERQREYMADLARSLEALQVKLDAAQNHRSSIRSHLNDDNRRSSSSSKSTSTYTFPSFSSSDDDAPRERSYNRRSTSSSSSPRASSSPRSGDRRAFVFDEDLRRDYPEEVFGVAEPFHEFDRMEDSINRIEAQTSAELEMSGFEDPLRSDLEDRFRRLRGQDDLKNLKDRSSREAPPVRRSSPAPSKASTTDMDAIRRQLAEDLDL